MVPTATTARPAFRFVIRASYVWSLAACVATAEMAMSFVPTSSTKTRSTMMVMMMVMSRRRFSRLVIGFIVVGLAVSLQKARFSSAFSSVIVGVDTSVAVSVQKARFSSAFSSVVVGVGVCVDAGVGVSIGIGIDV